MLEKYIHVEFDSSLNKAQKFLFPLGNESGLCNMELKGYKGSCITGNWYIKSVFQRKNLANALTLQLSIRS